jgi:hypothetical protein
VEFIYFNLKYNRAGSALATAQHILQATATAN